MNRAMFPMGDPMMLEAFEEFVKYHGGPLSRKEMVFRMRAMTRQENRKCRQIASMLGGRDLKAVSDPVKEADIQKAENIAAELIKQEEREKLKSLKKMDHASKRIVRASDSMSKPTSDANCLEETGSHDGDCKAVAALVKKNMLDTCDVNEMSKSANCISHKTEVTRTISEDVIALNWTVISNKRCTRPTAGDINHTEAETKSYPLESCSKPPKAIQTGNPAPSDSHCNATKPGKTKYANQPAAITSQSSLPPASADILRQSNLPSREQDFPALKPDKAAPIARDPAATNASSNKPPQGSWASPNTLRILQVDRQTASSPQHPLKAEDPPRSASHDLSTSPKSKRAREVPPDARRALLISPQVMTSDVKLPEWPAKKAEKFLSATAAEASPDVRMSESLVQKAEIVSAPAAAREVIVINDSDDDDLADPTLDPILLEVMRDPVLAADGFTYDRAVIEEWLAKGNTVSMVTREPLRHCIVIPNLAVRQLIARQHPEVRLAPFVA